MAKLGRPRTPRGRTAPKLTTRVSTAERVWFKGRAAELGMSEAKLQRDRLLFDMPGYKPDGEP